MPSRTVTITLSRPMALRLRAACREAEAAATNRADDRRPHPYRAADRVAARLYRTLGAAIIAAVDAQ